MNIFRTLWALGLAAAFGALSHGQTVTSTYDKDYGLQRLRTYEFRAEERDRSDPLASDTLTEGKIKDALDEELRGVGYLTTSNGAAPDFLIAFHVRVKDRAAEGRADRHYVEGVLIVDFYDAATKRLVWRGIATGVVGGEAVDLPLAEEKAKEAAKLLLERYGKDVLGF